MFDSDSVAGWQWSAQTAACASGLVAVVGLYLLARLLFDSTTALVAAFFLAVMPEPAHHSADGLSDMPHLALYLLGLAAVIFALQRRRVGFLAPAGALSGLAFLARPEGGTVAAVAVIAAMSSGTGWSVLRRVSAALLVAGCFFVVAGPYMTAAGRFVPKKSLRELFRFSPSEEAAASLGTGTRQWATAEPARSANGQSQCLEASTPQPMRAGMAAGAGVQVLKAVGQVIYYWARATRVVYLLLALLALLAVDIPRGDRVGRRIVAGTGAIHALLVVALVVSFQYQERLSLRHVVILAVLTLPWSASATVWIVRQLSRRLEPAAARIGSFRLAGVWLAVFAVIVAPTLPWLLRPIHAGAEYLRVAGEWIAERYPNEPVVLTTRSRVAFYAGGRMQRWPDTGQVTDLASHIDIFRPDLVVIDERNVLKSNPRFLDELRSQLVAPGRLGLLHEQRSQPPARPSRIYVYEVVKSPKMK